MWILVCVAGAAALAWMVLLVGRGGYWRTDTRLPVGLPDPRQWPDVVAVVPARNEAAILPSSLRTLLAQRYPGFLAVALVDDGSTDGTADVAARIGTAADRPLEVLRGAELPAGWAGKPWAMAQGVDAALAAHPQARYVLFTDADIAWNPDALRELVVVAEAEDRDLVSLMAMLRTETRWERLIIPAFVYFFAQLYPFRRVNRPRSRTAAAAGGCMLVRRDALTAAGGIERIRAALIDDVALGTLIKRHRGRCMLCLTTAVRSVRPYDSLADLWNMVTRSAYTQLNYSPALLSGTIVGLLWLFLLPPAAAVIGLAALPSAAAASCAAVGLIGWTLMAVTFAPMLRFYRLSTWRAPTLALVALLYAGMTLDSARRHYAGRGGAWKGRTSGNAPNG